MKIHLASASLADIKWAVDHGLADGVVNGWIRLLTTLPPAGRAGELAAVPYLCGFVGGALTVALARRYPRRVFCLLPPGLVLVASVLMGTKEPASLLLQGILLESRRLAVTGGQPDARPASTHAGSHR